MNFAPKIIVVHRRNCINQLAGLPTGCWVEIDIEIHEGIAYLTHDALTETLDKARPAPDRLDAYIPEALKQGVAGFIVDCKRESAERFVKPILESSNVTNYCYLNEMEVQADIFQELDPTHQSCMRVWKYRNADDVVRMTEDMKKIGQPYPQWIWIDSWQRGLLQDINKAFLPMTGTQATALQKLGVKLCICSPELYIHKYETPYTADQLSGFYNGILDYRSKLENADVHGDAFCSKFPWLWTLDLALLFSAGNRLGTLDFSAYNQINESDIQSLLAT